MNITVKVLVANYINEQILSYMEKIYYCKINFEIGIFDEVNNEYIKKITEGSIKELEYTNVFDEICGFDIQIWTNESDELENISKDMPMMMKSSNLKEENVTPIVLEEQAE